MDFGKHQNNLRLFTPADQWGFLVTDGEEVSHSNQYRYFGSPKEYITGIVDCDVCQLQQRFTVLDPHAWAIKRNAEWGTAKQKDANSRDHYRQQLEAV